MTVDDQEEFKAWDLPFVEDTSQTEEKKTTNAFNRRSDWKYEPPELEVEILPPHSSRDRRD
jgi:flagellar assembly protein FliH